jgi:ABC-type transport system involved in multi-copper enzyme maturation permease subunit
MESNLPTVESGKRHDVFSRKLWMKQIWAIVQLEIRKNFLGKRAAWIYLLAFAPVLLLGAKAVMPLRERELEQFSRISYIYAGIFQLYFLRVGIFFGCVGIFTYLFRGEMLEKSLHFYFLAPIRRDILVVGKYLSGLVTAVTLFAAGTFLSYLLIYLPYKSSSQALFSTGPGIQHLTAYLGITVLACIGYGSIFLLTGVLFRNPVIPAVVILGWESINFVLPPMLQRISVTHYLQSLCPVTLPKGPFAMMVDPTPLWVSVFGLFCLTCAVILVTAFSVRHMEISYGAD